VNEQLGGIDGRPIELSVCNTEFSAEGSTSCGQRFVEDEVVAVLGGIDVFGNAVETWATTPSPTSAASP
jgi:branched-chain amino acid transport system substrate-binding protein